jgi:hypothetical protein
MKQRGEHVAGRWTSGVDGLAGLGDFRPASRRPSGSSGDNTSMNTRTYYLPALLASVFLLMTAAPHRAAEVVLDLAGKKFGTTTAISVNSGTARLPAATVYEFELEGSMHGTGLLALLIPNGTSFQDLAEVIAPGTVLPTSGTVENPTGRLPFLVVNQRFSGAIPIPGLPISGTGAFAIRAGVNAAGSVQFDLSISGLSIPGIPAGEVEFEPGTKLTIRSIFEPFAGTYCGLVGSTPFSAERQGMVKITVTPGGLMTGSLKLGAKLFPFRAALGATNKTPEVKIGATGLKLELGVDLNATTVVTATLKDTGPLGTVSLERAKYLAGPPLTRSGGYTVALFPPALAGADTPSTKPVGAGFLIGTVTVNGNVTFTGQLCDGKPITSGGLLVTGDVLPFHAAVFGGKGAVFGNLTLRAESDTNDLDGTLRWFKPDALTARAFTEKLFTAGLDLDLNVAGSRYFKPAPGQRAMAASSSSFEFISGNLGAPVGIDATLDQRNIFLISPAAKLRAVLVAAKGNLLGSYTPPGKPALPFKGVILQKQNFGAGFFVGVPALGGRAESGIVLFND